MANRRFASLSVASSMVGLIVVGVRLQADLIGLKPDVTFDDREKVDADGTTALHWAVRANDLPAVQRLLRDGAAINVANRNGVTPLLLAAINTDAVMVE